MSFGHADLVHSGGVLSSRLRMLLPTPIARALEAATARRGADRERLQARLDLMDGVLRFLVAVQDAERAWLGLPPPPELDALARRLDRSTYGLWGAAAKALARQLDGVADRPLPAIGAGLLPGAEQPILHDGAEALIDLRNRIAHSKALIAASEAQVAGWLEHSTVPFRQLVRGLDVLCELRLVVALESRHRLQGGFDCRVTVHQGERPLALTVQTPAASLRPYLPVALGRDGQVVDLHPWLVCDREHGDHRLLFLDGWDAAGPTFSGCSAPTVPLSGTAAARYAVPSSPPGSTAGDWLSARPARSAPVPREVLGRLRPPLEDARPPRVRSLEIVRPLGRGGSGTVWLVEDPDRGGQRLALKVLHPQLATHRDHTERLRQEYAALQRLRVPGTVRVEEVFLDEEHGPCMLMEWVDGPSLRTVIRERAPVPPAEAVRICRLLLDTLAVAHERGILHRDVKPSNVVMDGDRPRLIDFGVARTADGLTLTATADIVGTIAYAAPEQLAGRPARPAADLYGVGRILEELLLGPPERRGPELELPAGIQRALRRALQRDPDARYASAAEMVAALEQALRERAGGPLIGPGERLPGGVTVQAVLGEVAPDLFVLSADHVAFIVPGASGSARARVHQVPAQVPRELRARHSCFQVLHTDDGVPFLQLAPDRPMERARELLAALGEVAPPAGGPARVEVTIDEDALFEDTTAASPAGPAPDVRPAETGTPARDPGSGGADAAALLALATLAAAATGAAASRARARPPSATGKKRRRGRTPQGALFGGLVSILQKVGQQQVGGVAHTETQRLHHAGLFLLGLEHAVSGLDLSVANWREAWRFNMGGFLVLAKLHDRSAGPVGQALRDTADVGEVERVALRLAQRRTLAPDGHPDLAFLAGVGRDVFGAAVPQLQEKPTGWRADYAHVLEQRLVVRRVPAASGWQAVEAALLTGQ